MKHYRTNFWSAQPDPTDANAFYLSHRGKNSEAARFAITLCGCALFGRSLLAAEASTPTSKLMTFERVFGFSGEIDPKITPHRFSSFTD